MSLARPQVGRPRRVDLPALTRLAGMALLLLGRAAWAGPASAPATGAGGAPADTAARTWAEAQARHADALRRCDRLGLAALRAECRRQADRVLAADRARLARGGALP